MTEAPQCAGALAGRMMTPDEQRIWDDAIAFARANKKPIARRLTDKALYLPETEPVSVFMAGSPGAGKTEASVALLKHFDTPVLRIDPDELRSENSDEYPDEIIEPEQMSHVRILGWVFWWSTIRRRNGLRLAK